jgi:hypothetical protein
MAALDTTGKPSPMLDPSWTPWKAYGHAAALASLVKIIDAKKAS